MSTTENPVDQRTDRERLEDITVKVDGREVEGTIGERPDDAEPGVQADDDTSGLPPAADTTAKGELFDASDYEREGLAIPKVDGNQIDKIRFKFSGSVLLNRSEIPDVALFNGAKLGRDLDLRIEAKVAGTGVGFTTNKEGDLDVVVGEKTLRVETVYIVDPENL